MGRELDGGNGRRTDGNGGQPEAGLGRSIQPTAEHGQLVTDTGAEAVPDERVEPVAAGSLKVAGVLPLYQATAGKSNGNGEALTGPKMSGIHLQGLCVAPSEPLAQQQILHDLVSTYERHAVYRDLFYDRKIGFLIEVGPPGIGKTTDYRAPLKMRQIDWDRLEEERDRAAGMAAADKERLDQRLQEAIECPYRGQAAAILDSITSPVELYCAAYRYRNMPLVIDDNETLHKGEDGRGVLKCLCQTEPRRVVNWNKNSPVLAQRRIPRWFTTTSPVAILCNSLGRIRESLGALLDRALVIQFSPPLEEIHEHARPWVCREHPDIWNWIGERLSLCPVPSLRWYYHAIERKKAGQDWSAWLCRVWTSLEPDMGALVRCMDDPRMTTEKEREAQFEALTGKTRATYYRVKSRWAIMHRREGEHTA